MNACMDTSTRLAADQTLLRILPDLRPKLQAVLRRFRVSPVEGEDLVQESLLLLVQRWNEVESPEAWLLSTLKWRCIMHWRRQRRRLAQAVDQSILELLAEPLAPEQEKAALRNDIARALESLSPRCRSLLRLRYGLGLKPGEVAARLDYSPKSVGKLVGRCQLALCQRLLDLGYTSSSRASGRESALATTGMPGLPLAFASDAGKV